MVGDLQDQRHSPKLGAMFDTLAEHVRAAAARPEACAAVHELYARLGQAVEERKPICIVSGRCCRFEEYGHRLYVTTMELAAFTANISVPPQANPGGCPFQVGKLCGVHAIRPMGCRIFFCDPTAGQWQQQLYEQLHAELKQLHERLAIPYFYVEWRAALTALELDGKL